MAKTKIAPNAEELATASTVLTTTETTSIVPSATGDHYADETSRDVQLPVIGLVNKVGKLADFVILDRNPLAVPILTLADLKVLETIKDGKTVYLAK